jgi:hypothetical protein
MPATKSSRKAQLTITPRGAKATETGQVRQVQQQHDQRPPGIDARRGAPHWQATATGGVGERASKWPGLAGGVKGAGGGGGGGADIATSQLTMRCGSNIFASRPPSPMLAGAGSLAGPSSECASPGGRARAAAGLNRRRPSRRRLRHCCCCCCWAGPAPTRPHSGSRFLPNPTRCGGAPGGALRFPQARHGAFLGRINHKGNGRWQNRRLRRPGAALRGNAHVASL